MYKSLRSGRIAFSLIFMALLTYAILDAAFAISIFGRWLINSQLVEAILAGSTLWIVLWVLITLTFGRVYCSTVCPLGTLQDIAGHCGCATRKGDKKWYKYAAPVNMLRFTIPAVVAACLFVGFTIVVKMTDPFSIYGKMVVCILRPAAIAFGSVFAAWALLFLVSLVAWRRGRIICNTVCPIGGLLGLLSRSPIYRVDINTDLCIHCGKCEDVCKAQCIDLKNCVVDNSRCVMCMDCTAACPNSAITVRRGRYKLGTPMMQKV